MSKSSLKRCAECTRFRDQDPMNVLTGICSKTGTIVSKFNKWNQECFTDIVPEPESDTIFDRLRTVRELAAIIRDGAERANRLFLDFEKACCDIEDHDHGYIFIPDTYGNLFDLDDTSIGGAGLFDCATALQDMREAMDNIHVPFVETDYLVATLDKVLSNVDKAESFIHESSEFEFS